MTTTAAINFITDGFPAPGLRPVQRLITGNKEEDGKGHFLVTDAGDHHRVMGENQAVANIIYSTNENPVDLNEDKDIKFSQENEVRLILSNTWFPHDVMLTRRKARSPYHQRHCGAHDRLRPWSRVTHAPCHVNRLWYCAGG